MKLADLIEGIPLSAAPSTASSLDIFGLTDDSRQVTRGTLFAALPGTKADGATYALEAEKRGAAAILLHANANGTALSIPLLRSGEPRQALARLAARFYGAQPEIVVAVTGTNGKTSVASFLRQIWAAIGYEAASLGTVGIVTRKGHAPLAHTTPDPVFLHKQLLQLAKEGVTHLALEASSHGLDQHRLDGVRFAGGAFTNVTRDHLDYHKSFEDYLNAKLRLFRELLPPEAPAVIDMDGPGASAAIDAAKEANLRTFTIGEGGKDIVLKGVERQGFKQLLSLLHEGNKLEILLPLAGAFQISNALIGAGLAIALGANAEDVFSGVVSVRGAKGRLEFVGETAQAAPIFIDYAHTPDALVKALQSLRPYAKGRLHVVFGCGGDRDKGKRPEMGRAAVTHADCVIVTDDNPRSEEPRAIRKAILDESPGAVEIVGRAVAIATAIASLKRGDILLVAGKGHETGQIIGEAVIPYSDHEAVTAALASESAPHE